MFFFRFHWLCPLQTEHSRGVKENIKKIFAVHSMPEMLQSDKWERIQRVSEAILPNEKDMNRLISTIQSEDARKSGAVSSCSSCLEK